MPTEREERQPLVWTKYTGKCQSCKKTFRVSQQAIDESRHEYPAQSEFEAANSFEFCIGCISGKTVPGEIKAPTIIVVMQGGQVQAVQSDFDPADAPTVYVLDYDTEGVECEYLINHTFPLSSLPNGPTQTVPAACYEWPLDDPDLDAVRRLEEALAATHETEPEGKVFYPGDEKELNDAIDAHVTRTPEGWDSIDTSTEHHTNVAQEEPVENWRLPPNHRLDAHRAAHGEPGTAERVENDGTLSL